MDDAPGREQLLVHHDFIAEHRNDAGHPLLSSFFRFGRQFLEVSQGLVPAEAEESVSQVLGGAEPEPGDHVIACAGLRV